MGNKNLALIADWLMPEAPKVENLDRGKVLYVPPAINPTRVACFKTCACFLLGLMANSPRPL
uniref:Uncharacterized protein n=1 Tax=Romanomermis culicivorax TaxID=13658 RepID=A0A915I8Z6_ROMCU